MSFGYDTWSIFETPWHDAIHLISIDIKPVIYHRDKAILWSGSSSNLYWSLSLLDCSISVGNRSSVVYYLLLFLLFIDWLISSKCLSPLNIKKLHSLRAGPQKIINIFANIWTCLLKKATILMTTRKKDKLTNSTIRHYSISKSFRQQCVHCERFC